MNPDIREQTAELPLDVSDQVSLFSDFFNGYLLSKIFEVNNSDKESLTVDFSQLSQFSVELSELLLSRPEEVLKAAELALSKLDVTKKIHLRFSKLPLSQRLLVRDIRSKHIGKFYSVIGIIKQKSGVKPMVLSARFECPSCGNIITLAQDEQVFKQPQHCSCGRKGKFRRRSRRFRR